MANSGEIPHFNIATPRLGPLPSGGRPPALEGAGIDPVHGDVRMLTGAGGDLVPLRRAMGPPSTLGPDRDRSVTPRRAGRSPMLRSGSSPPHHGRALQVSRMASQRQMPDGGTADQQCWMECTEEALRTQKRRFEEVAANYMLGTRQVIRSEHAELQ